MPMCLWLGFVGAACAQESANVLASLPVPMETIRLSPTEDATAPPVITSIRLHQNGRWIIAAGDDHVIRIIDRETQRELRRIRGHRDWVKSVEISPDGRWLATAGADRRLILWNLLQNQRHWQSDPLPGAIRQVRFTKQGSRLAAVGFKLPLYVFDVESGQPLRQLACPSRDTRAVAFSDGDALVAVGGQRGMVRVWQLDSGTLLRTFKAHDQRIRDLTFDAVTDQLITAGEDRKLRVWDLHSPQTPFQELSGTPGKVLSMTALSEGVVATACSDNMIRVWDLERHELLSQLRGHSGSVVTMDTDGTVLVSAGYDATIRIWPMREMSEAIAILQRQQTRTVATENSERSDEDATTGKNQRRRQP